MKLFIMASLVFFTFYSSMAGDKKKSFVENPIEVVRIGLFSEQPVYSISKISNDQQPILIVVKDEFGELLYEQILTDKSKTMQLQFNTLELGNTAIIIEAYASNGILQYSSKVMPSAF